LLLLHISHSLFTSEDQWKAETGRGLKMDLLYSYNRISIC